MLFVRPHHPLRVTASWPHVTLRAVCSGRNQRGGSGGGSPMRGRRARAATAACRSRGRGWDALEVVGALAPAAAARVAAGSSRMFSSRHDVAAAASASLADAALRRARAPLSSTVTPQTNAFAHGASRFRARKFLRKRPALTCLSRPQLGRRRGRPAAARRRPSSAALGSRRFRQRWPTARGGIGGARGRAAGVLGARAAAGRRASPAPRAQAADDGHDVGAPPRHADRRLGGCLKASSESKPNSVAGAICRIGGARRRPATRRRRCWRGAGGDQPGGEGDRDRAHVPARRTPRRGLVRRASSRASARRDVVFDIPPGAADQARAHRGRPERARATPSSSRARSPAARATARRRR